jgi:Leucine-rich repeat (LRR) protein
MIEVLFEFLAVPIGKFLLKNYLGDAEAAVGGGLLDLAKKKLNNYQERKDAEREFTRLGEKVAGQLLPIFEQAKEEKEFFNPEAVAKELALTLEGKIAADFFLSRDLDPAKLSQEFRQTRPLPRGQLGEAETALYEKSLDETVRYVVAVVDELPKFEATYAAQSLQRLRTIGDGVDKVLESNKTIQRNVELLLEKVESLPLQIVSGKVEVLEIRKGTEQAALVPSQVNTRDGKVIEYEINYRQAVARKLNYVELFGADLSTESKRQDLSVAYVSLNLNYVAESIDGEILRSVEDVLTMLTPEQGRLLIRGEAGSGKSTLFRWTAIEAAKLFPEWSKISNFTLDIKHRSRNYQKFFEEVIQPFSEPILISSITDELSSSYKSLLANYFEAKSPLEDIKFPPTSSINIHALALSLGSSWRLKVPFLLRLRDFQKGKLPAPDDFPAYLAKELGNPPADWVLQILKDGRGLILLDGVDEIPNSKRDDLFKEIRDIVETYPDNYYMVSTRPAAVPDDWLESLGFQEATVNPMNSSDREQFIKNWHEAVAEELKRLGRPDPQLPEIAKELMDKLPDNPSIARLATNPLLCAMVCALHRERSQKLPETQAELVEAICHMLLHRRERESGLELSEFPQAYRDLLYDHKRAIVQDIAHYMVRNGESVISKKQAAEEIADALKTIPGRNPAEATEILTSLIERSGTLRENSPESVDFIHNTIKEFLASEKFVEDGDIGQLVSKADDASWQPVIAFAASTRKRDFASKLISKLISTTDKAPKSARHFLALRCRAVALHLEPSVAEEVERIEKGLFPPKTMAEAAAIAEGGDTVVNYLGNKKNLSARQAAASVRALRLIGTRKAKAMLESYLKDKRQTVFLELSQAVNPLDIEAVREIVSSAGKSLPGEIAQRIKNLSPLANLTALQSLDLYRTQISDLSPLANLTTLQSLDLDGTQVSDLSPLTNLTALQSLGLSGTQISDLSPLTNLTALQSLDLRGTQVSDLSPLANLTALQSLDLRGTQVSNLSPLADLTTLQYLDLNGTQVSDLSPLTNLTALQSLGLSGTQISDLSPLTNLTALQSLDLRGTQVSNLSPLADLTTLQYLDLNGTQVSDLSPLTNLTALQSLGLSGTQISDLSPLTNLTALQSLDLRGTQVSNLSPLADLTTLQYLDLDGTQISDLSLLSKLTALQYLYLSGTQVSDLSPLANLTALQRLGLNGTQVSDLSTLTKLKHVEIFGLPASHSTEQDTLLREET